MPERWGFGSVVCFPSFVFRYLFIVELSGFLTKADQLTPYPSSTCHIAGKEGGNKYLTN